MTALDTHQEDPMVDDDNEPEGAPRVVIAIAALAAGLVAQKVVQAVWRLVRGDTPNQDDESALAETIVFAAATAAAAATARAIVTNRAKKTIVSEAD